MYVYEAKMVYEATLFHVPGTKLNRADLVAEYMKDVMTKFPMNETMWIILLNRKNAPLGRHMLTLGTATAALIHPREFFRAAIVGGASGCVAYHNHPSGDPSPSGPDIQVTRLLREASKTVDIDLLDHVIGGDREQDPQGRGYFSFREAGLI